MNVGSFQNYNQLADYIYGHIKDHGVKNDSRNGPVLRLPGITAVEIFHPWERVCLNPVRDCNPFFHFIEAMAMICEAPFNDVAFLSYFAKNMKTYSDNGVNYNAFYGTRARETWGDQIQKVIEELEEKPDTRQAVVQLWDPQDLWNNTKDKACNMTMVFSIVGSHLSMTTFNRSNDAIWGFVSGANIVHLSFFQEYIACALQKQMGPWTHISNNMHVYTDNPQWDKVCQEAGKNNFVKTCPYLRVSQPVERLLRLFGKKEEQAQFDIALNMCLGDIATAIDKAELVKPKYNLRFIDEMLVPIFNAFQSYKLNKGTPKGEKEPFTWTSHIYSEDWRLACTEWLERRVYKSPSNN